MRMSITTAASSPAGGYPLVERSRRFAAMGGQVTLRIAAPVGTEVAADRDLRLLADRICSWASRLTRFEAHSELGHLNRCRDQAATVVGPSLGDVLRRSQRLSELTADLVDVTLLEARLAAEQGAKAARTTAGWRIEPCGRRYRVHRAGRVSFDLDGVGKGWIADRALAALGRYRSAMVDADGDVALRQDDDVGWGVAIADPRTAIDLGVIARPPAGAPSTIGIATSGTTVHRWQQESGWSHHLIDPRTGRSADTDVVQATVVADGALVAEALAKAVVIAGSDDGLWLLEQAGAIAAFMLLRDGELIASEGSEEWLA